MLPRNTFILPALMLLIIIGAGCAKPSTTPAPDTTSPSSKAQEPTEQVHQYTPESKAPDSETIQALEAKQVPLDPYDLGYSNLDVFDYDRSDCLGMVNGYTRGGDLLTTLAENPQARKGLKLNVLTPEYLRDLRSTASRIDADRELYTFYICHLSDSVDLVAGKLWPKDQKTWSVNENGEIIIDNQFEEASSNSALIIVSNDTAYRFDGLRLTGQTLTGGETYPCQGSIVESNVRWKCLAGWDPENRPGEVRMKITDIPIPPSSRSIKTFETWEE